MRQVCGCSVLSESGPVEIFVFEGEGIRAHELSNEAVVGVAEVDARVAVQVESAENGLEVDESDECHVVIVDDDGEGVRGCSEREGRVPVA